ncbi:hypothetical protein [Desulfovulcanus sp.]
MRWFIVFLHFVFIFAFVCLDFRAPDSSGALAWAGDYDFDLDAELGSLAAANAASDQKLKILSFNAEAALSENIALLRRNSRLFKQRYYDNFEQKFATEFDANLKFMAEYKKEALTSYVRLDFESTRQANEWSSDGRVDEAYVLLQPDYTWSIGAGKKVLRWGRGYFVNPVSFFSRPKDVNDPEAMEEGYVLLYGDYIKSYTEGPLQTVTLTPVILPVTEKFNQDFLTSRTFNYGAKLYLLIYDTDIDLMFIADKDGNPAYGADFAYNLTSNLEIHGEIARTFASKVYINDDNTFDYDGQYAISYLLGLRYLNTHDTTFILEYYHNGHGYEKEDMGDYYEFIDSAYEDYQNTGMDLKLKKSMFLGKEYFNQSLVMQDYAYVKITQKEPFDILYFNPSLIVLFNLDDYSSNIGLEFLYTPVANLDLKARLSVNQGDKNTEFGEKAGSGSLFLEARYYF